MIIYTRQPGGTMTRHSLKSMTRLEHSAIYLSPSDFVPYREVLVGWPETFIDWVTVTWGYGIVATVPPLNLYRLSRSDKVDCGDYEIFRASVVAAESVEDAKDMHPGTGLLIDWVIVSPKDSMEDWVILRPDVVVTYLGIASPDVVRGVICSDFLQG